MDATLGEGASQPLSFCVSNKVFDQHDYAHMSLVCCWDKLYNMCILIACIVCIIIYTYLSVTL